MVLISHNSQTWRTYTQKFNTNQIKRYHQSTNHRSIKIPPQNPSQNTNITTSTIPKPHNNCINEREFKSNIQSKIKNLENKVPQSHLYSLVPQILEWAFQSDCTAYFFEHFSHFHFFSPCFLQKCFFIPVRSPRALDGSWCTQDCSGHTYTLFFTSLLDLCLSFHGRLWPRRWSCRFWSLWNPLLQISQTNRFVAIRVFGDRAITSASGSAITPKTSQKPKNQY